MQTLKHYMHHNLSLKKGQAIKKWVAQVFNLNEYLQEIPKVNGNANLTFGRQYPA